MTRIDIGDPIQAIRQLRTDMDEFKGAQFVGPNSLLGYLKNSASPYDHTLHLTANQRVTFTITFTHSEAKHGSIQQLSLFYSLNDPNVTTGFYPAWANGPPVFYFIQKLPPTDTINRWKVEVVNNGASIWDVYFKLVFYGTDNGSWTIT